MYRFSIFCCLVLLATESYADFWCSDNTLEFLMNCLLGTNIQPVKPFTFNMVKLKSRIKCAKKAECILKPWDLRNVNIRQARNYAKCMKKINPESDVFVDLVRFEYRCRKELAEPYKDDVKYYYMSLLPPEKSSALTHNGITLYKLV